MEPSSAIAEISCFLADDLVFPDESIFNEKTGWRHMPYAPIGHETRYSASVWRGQNWSIMTLEGWHWNKGGLVHCATGSLACT